MLAGKRCIFSSNNFQANNQSSETQGHLPLTCLVCHQVIGRKVKFSFQNYSKIGYQILGFQERSSLCTNMKIIRL